MGKQLPKPVEVLSGIKQIGASVPLGAIEHEANNVDVSRIIRLSPKVHQPKN
jgi:two-component system nitrate/nitrite response regulator NarL